MQHPMYRLALRFLGNPDDAQDACQEILIRIVTRLGTWYENIESAELLTPPPLAVGARIAFAARFLGRRLAYTYEVREYVPGDRLCMSTADGPFAMETTYTWAEVSGGTRMTLRNRGEPSGFSRVAGPALAAAMRRANRKDLERLREILEATTS